MSNSRSRIGNGIISFRFLNAASFSKRFEIKSYQIEIKGKVMEILAIIVVILGLVVTLKVVW